MKRFILAPALAALAFSAAPLDGAAPVVSDLTAAQRTGTKLVDIGYSVTADAPTVTGRGKPACRGIGAQASFMETQRVQRG